MAVTKIKPIRGTVNKALAYILDPQKTDNAFYVSSYGCAASDAAAKEFEWTRNLAVQQGMQMPKVLARHLIQSFDIGKHVAQIDDLIPDQSFSTIFILWQEANEKMIVVAHCLIPRYRLV